MLRKMLSMALMSAFFASVSIYTYAADNRNKEAAEINVKLGEGYMAKGDLKRAMDKLTRATQLDSKYAPAYTLLAMLYEQINDLTAAEKNYKKVMSLEAKSGAAANNYGAFLCRNGRAKAGIEMFDRAVRDPFYETPDMALVNKGACAASLGDNVAAEKALREALLKNPENTDALYELARSSVDQKKYLQARAFVERHAAAAPMTAELLALGILVEKELGDVKRADEYHTRLVQNFPDSEQARALLNSKMP